MRERQQTITAGLEKAMEADEAGELTCLFCSFVFYRTTDMCPKCGTFYGARLKLNRLFTKSAGHILKLVDEVTNG